MKERIMCEVLDDYEGSVSIEDRRFIINFLSADDTVVNAEKVEDADIYIGHEVQNGR